MDNIFNRVYYVCIMYRLFIALPVPEEIKDSILGLRTNIPGARWMEKEQLHITLKFIGEVDGGSFRQIKDLLAGIGYKSFTLRFSGVGVFPPGGRGGRSSPRVLWTGVENMEKLAGLRNRIERKLKTAGIPEEKRKFSPHLTLARLKNPSESALSRFLSINHSFRTNTFTAERFFLYSSILKPSGAVYTVEADYPLTETDLF